MEETSENNKNELKQIKADYIDWDRHHGYNLETQQIDWLIETVENQQKKIEGLEIVIDAERSFINSLGR